MFASFLYKTRQTTTAIFILVTHWHGILWKTFIKWQGKETFPIQTTAFTQRSSFFIMNILDPFIDLHQRTISFFYVLMKEHMMKLTHHLLSLEPQQTLHFHHPTHQRRRTKPNRNYLLVLVQHNNQWIVRVKRRQLQPASLRQVRVERSQLQHSSQLRLRVRRRQLQHGNQ